MSGKEREFDPSKLTFEDCGMPDSPTPEMPEKRVDPYEAFPEDQAAAKGIPLSHQRVLRDRNAVARRALGLM